MKPSSLVEAALLRSRSLQGRQRLEFVAQAKKKLLQLEERQLLEGSLIEFFRAAWHVMDPAPYQHGWHLEAFAEHLEAVSYGHIRKLCINVCPRHAKTLMCSVAWNAWMWCKPPDERYPLIGPGGRFMCLSYGDQLAMDNATLSHRLIESKWYQERWGDRVTITLDQDAKNKFDTTAGGTRISGSFGGSVTGRGAGIRVYDDPHKMDEVESDKIREGVLRIYDTTLKSRITDPRVSAEVLVAQRGHVKDLSDKFLGTGDVVHLNLPAEYDPYRHCATVLRRDENGAPIQTWEDPRTEDKELLWPERWGRKELATYRTPAHEWAAQWQQSPEARGGGILKREHWTAYELAVGASPRHDFDLVIASLDPAFTSKQENDPSGFTVWGVYREQGDAKVILLHAWKKWLELHGKEVPKEPDESHYHYAKRAGPNWGLVEWVAHECKRLRVRILLIEDKGSGHSVAQEIQRLYGDKEWGTELVNPGELDKRARAYAISHLFTAGMISAPASPNGGEWREWAEMVISECERFRGFPGEEDNLVDSVTQALKFLRDSGFAVRPEERKIADDAMALYKRPSKRLYEV